MLCCVTSPLLIIRPTFHIYYSERTTSNCNTNLHPTQSLIETTMPALLSYQSLKCYRNTNRRVNATEILKDELMQNNVAFLKSYMSLLCKHAHFRQIVHIAIYMTNEKASTPLVNEKDVYWYWFRNVICVIPNCNNCDAYVFARLAGSSLFPGHRGYWWESADRFVWHIQHRWTGYAVCVTILGHI